MRTRRAVSMLALVIGWTISLGACASINEVMADRALTCEATSDELCIRIADIAVDGMPGEVSADWATVTSANVAPIDCADVERGLQATRCWQVGGTYLVGYADIPLTSEIEPTDFQWIVYERLDGAIVAWQ